MPLYVYKAVDPQGKVIKGEMEAVSEMEITTQLAKTGYLPVSISYKLDRIKAVQKFDIAAKLSKFLEARKTASPQSVIIFTRQFTSVIKAAVPLLEGLGILAQQSEDIALKGALNDIVHDVESGLSLSAAMSKHPNVFSDLYVNTVIAGEKAGVLEKVLGKLAGMLEEDYETRMNINTAMRYPVMVVLALVSAVVVMSLFVVPQFTKIYKDAHMALPLPTQVIIFISDLIRNKWFILFPSIIGGFFLFTRFINTRDGRMWWDLQKFRAPIIGKVYTKITMLRFTSMLSVLYQAGLPVLSIMDIVGATIGNKVLTREIDSIKKDVSAGKGISAAVLKSAFFPRLVGYMISIGEKSGSLPMMLDSLYDYFHLEVKTSVKNLTTMIEPVMTALLGGVVTGMALAVFLPLWNLIQVFKG